MARLTAEQRRSLAAKQFAEPGKKAFPINDLTHAEQAIRMSGHKPPAEAAKIKAAARNKFPQLRKSGMRG